MCILYTFIQKYRKLTKNTKNFAKNHDFYVEFKKFYKKGEKI